MIHSSIWLSRAALLALRRSAGLAALPLLALLTLAAPAAHAQATLRVSTQENLRLTYGSGITVGFNIGSFPVTASQFTGNAMLTNNFFYSNSITFNNNLPNGISTNTVVELTTGNTNVASTGVYNLLFTPTLTVTNTTNTLQSYSLQYDVVFASNVNAVPNTGTALAAESVSIVLNRSGAGDVSNFSQSLSRTNGSLTDNNGPASVSTTYTINPNSSTVVSLRTTVNTQVNFTPPAPSAAAPEPSALALLLPALPLTGMVLRRRKAARK